jgi:hypothetical protein
MMVDSTTLISLDTQFIQTKEGEKFLNKVEGINLDKFKELLRKKNIAIKILINVSSDLNFYL